MKLLISLLAFSSFFYPSSHAQEDNQDSVIVVNNNKNTQINDIEEASEEIKDTAGASDIVDEKEWEGRRATTLQDITQYSPSVFIQPRNGAEASRLSIRGSGLSSIYQGRGLFLSHNGVPITQADGEFEFQSIDPWLIKYALVRPGANALEYGASNFGGAIDLITPTGKDQTGANARYEIGSFQTHHALISQAAKGENWDAFGALSYFSQEGYRSQNVQDSLRLNTNFGYQSSKNVQHRVYFNHISSDAQIPGTLTREQVSQDPTQGKGINVSRDYSRNLDLSQIAYRNKVKLKNSEWSNTLYYNYRDLDNPVFTYIYRVSEDMGVRTKYERFFDSSQFIAGFNFYHTVNTENRFENAGGDPGDFILTRDTKALTGEVYSQYEHRLSQEWFVLTNLQVSWAERTVDELRPVNQKRSQYYQGINPRLGFRWEPNYKTQVFTNLSRSFEPPTLGEVSRGNDPGFRELEAQKATLFELGLRTQLKNMNLQASYYHGWLEGELINYRFPDSTTQTINSKKSSRDGVELGARGELFKDVFKEGDALDFTGAYTWSYFKLTEDESFEDNHIPGLPEHFLRFELMYDFSEKFSIGPNFQTASSYHIDIANSELTKVPAYFIYGARAKYESGSNWLIYLDANNLTDKNYIATADVVPDSQNTDDNFYYPGEGLSFYLGVEWGL